MSPRRRRFTTRTAIVAAVLVAAVPHSPVAAQPPAGSEDAMERYQRLGAEAADAEEDLAEAKDALKARQRERDTANADLKKAKQTLAEAKRSEERFRGQMDSLSESMFRNGQIVRWSAVFTSGTPETFLQQMATLDKLATDNSETLNGLIAVTTKADKARSDATAAQKRSQDATTAAEKAVVDIEAKTKRLDTQMREVRGALDDLSAGQREDLNTVKDNGVYLGPPGAADDALQAALSRRGSEYEWGATGPAEFDCSGLTSWAYRQAGVTIPRTSRQQWTAGRAVSLDALVPGDLLFYDDGTGNPSQIHHVGMYVGNGKMVDAPTEGQLVDVRSMRGDGHLIGARRIVG